MKNLLLLMLSGILSAIGYGQYDSPETLDKVIATFSDEDLLIESSRLLEEGYYTSAEKMVDKLLKNNPDNANYNYRKGFLLSEGKNDFAGAVPHLEKAVKTISKNYDMYARNETGSAVDALFRLGKAYHRTGKLDKATENYRAFLDQSTGKSELTVFAELGLTQIGNAQKAMQNPKQNVEIINLGELINSSYPDYSPVVSFDGSSLYYTSRRPWPDGKSDQYKDPRYDLFSEDVYVAYKDFDDSWIPASRLEFCHADQNEASLSVSNDERRIYVYQDIVGNGDIFYSDFSDNRFKDIKAYPDKGVNTKFWETHCTVTPDGRTMYFASERPEGFGGRDIYRIVLLPDDSWSQPQNLGPTINSEFDEDGPFMASDNRTLYYASNGPMSMGGFDIIVSVIDEDNNWSMPINLGYPVNSTNDDLFYTETVDGRRGYITSIRGDTRGEKDIYEIRNDYLTTTRGAILKGKVITLDERPLPEDITITLACTDCGEQTERTAYPRSRDGLFMMNLEPCHTYDVIFRHQNGEIEFYRETMTTSCEKQKEEIYREIYLDAERLAIVPAPVIDTTPVVIANVDPGTDIGPLVSAGIIYFDYRKWTIRPDAKKELNKIVQVMKKHPDIRIELGSHTDARGTDEENMVLSEKRARASAAYIISQGIAADRIVGKGYGESKVVVSESEIAGKSTVAEKEAGHQQNRRTEFVIVQ
jgi:outer membrane protein OmpA-like peptidoglycan-associated protein/tetratricopeptide (TPR) repeat protein